MCSFFFAAMFRTDGQLLSGTMCDYLFSKEMTSQLTRKIHSIGKNDEIDDGTGGGGGGGSSGARRTNFNTNMADQMQNDANAQQTLLVATPQWSNHPRGYFFSPQYPSTYPRATRCSYRFQADTNERIHLLFIDVSLQKIDQR